jgi:hypothetical protein
VPEYPLTLGTGEIFRSGAKTARKTKAAATVAPAIAQRSARRRANAPKGLTAATGGTTALVDLVGRLLIFLVILSDLLELSKG